MHINRDGIRHVAGNPAVINVQRGAHFAFYGPGIPFSVHHRVSRGKFPPKYFTPVQIRVIVELNNPTPLSTVTSTNLCDSADISCLVNIHIITLIHLAGAPTMFIGESKFYMTFCSCNPWFIFHYRVIFF